VVTIKEILPAPDKIIDGVIKCNIVTPDSRGGGGPYGAKGDIPGLVQ